MHYFIVCCRGVQCRVNGPLTTVAPGRRRGECATGTQTVIQTPYSSVEWGKAGTPFRDLFLPMPLLQIVPHLQKLTNTSSQNLAEF